MTTEIDKKNDSSDDTPTEPNIDLNQALAAIEEKVSQKLDHNFSSLEKKMQAQKTPEPDPEPLWGGDDEEYVSKKEMGKVVDQVLSKVKTESAKERQVIENRTRRDQEAFGDFPALKSNERFKKEVQKELDRRAKGGRNPETDADILYDSAAAVHARGQREGWYQPEEIVTQEQLKRRAENDSFPVNSYNPNQGVSEAQKNFAKSIGMNADNIENNLKKTSFYRKK